MLKNGAGKHKALQIAVIGALPFGYLATQRLTCKQPAYCPRIQAFVYCKDFAVFFYRHWHTLLFCTNCTTLNMTVLGKFYKKSEYFLQSKGASHTACPPASFLFIYYLWIKSSKTYHLTIYVDTIKLSATSFVSNQSS